MIEYWHNPRCSKSRAGLVFLQDAGVEVALRLYLENRPSFAEITTMWQALGQPPVIDMMRQSEAMFAELGLSDTDSDEVLITAMAAHPVLIERPLARQASKAIIGRPTERLQGLIDHQP